MARPLPGPLHARLAALEGAWEGDEEIFASPWSPAGPARGRWTFRRDPSGLHLIHDFAEARASGERFDGHGVLCVDPSGTDPAAIDQAIDPAAGPILWFWFDSFGFPPVAPARGRWDGPTLTLEKVTPRGLGRTRFTLEPGRLLQTVEARPAGAAAFAPVMTGRYRRA